jgi:hypothetical protein
MSDRLQAWFRQMSNDLRLLANRLEEERMLREYGAVGFVPNHA